MTQLTVVIPSSGTRAALRNCVEALKSSLPMSSEIIVVDNASADGSARMIQEQYGHVRLIKNTVNPGLAAALNQGIEAARGAYVLLLDPRTEVHGNVLRAMLGFLERNLRYGACAPRIVEPDGTTQRSVGGFPTIWTPLFVGTPLERALPNGREVSRYRALAHDYERDDDVDHAALACLLMRRKALKRGKPLDESLGSTYDGVDLCRRLWAAAWRVRYLAGAVVVHTGDLAVLAQAPVDARSNRDRLAYYRKHHGDVAGAWVKVCAAWNVLDLCVRELWRRAEGNPEQSLAPLWNSLQVLMKG